MVVTGAFNLNPFSRTEAEANSFRTSVADETALPKELPLRSSSYRIRIIGTVGTGNLVPALQMSNRTAGFNSGREHDESIKLMR